MVSAWAIGYNTDRLVRTCLNCGKVLHVRANGSDGEVAVSFEAREKFIQSGSGQVFYVWQDDDSGQWVVGIFVGGPEPIQPLEVFGSKSEAEACLTNFNCMPMK